MSEFILPQTVRVINTPSKYPITYLDNANAAAAVGAATKFSWQGVNNYITKLSDLTQVRIVRGIAAAKATYTITAATAAQITVAGTIAANTLAFFQFDVESIDRKSRFRRGTGYEYGVQPLVYQVLLQTGDTAAVILHKLHNSINAFANHERDYVIKSTEVGGSAGSPASLTLTMEESGTFIKRAYVRGADDQPAANITVFAPAVATPVFGGIGTGEGIEFFEKIKEGNAADVRYFDFSEIPVEGQLYTEVSWTVAYDRKAPKSAELSNLKRHTVYINESSGEALIDDLADLFLTPAKLAAYTKMEHPGGIVVGFNDAEAIVFAADAAAGEFDSGEYAVTYKKGIATGTAAKYLLLESVALPADAEGNATVLAKVKANA